MLFARAHIFLLYILSLTLLAVATPWGAGGGGEPTVTVTVTAPATTVTAASQCSTGDLKCCDSTVSSTSGLGGLLLGLLGIVVEGVEGLLGVACSPITVVGVGGGECSGTVVCCEDNSSSLISIGCLVLAL
ncbi:fungal hydrophobin [Obba rivulosa]|uniref:Hydrophobin n=1 Tax=Obba rivulosa TaxID=1052685 RepID=A0A8E2ALH2_9APHY|nr:fungal hydrophobin [Obba rivulosa]